MSHTLSMVWVEKELIPFLDLVYNVATGYTAKTHEEWETEVARAEKRINTIRNYDDSIITIDRIRLTLTSSPNVDAEDRAQIIPISDDQELIITMLVRHSISHGPYPLSTLGVAKDKRAIREREMLRANKMKLPDVVTMGRAGKSRGARSFGTSSTYGHENNYGRGNNHGRDKNRHSNSYMGSTYGPDLAAYQPVPFHVGGYDYAGVYQDAYGMEDHFTSPGYNANSMAGPPTATFSSPGYDTNSVTAPPIAYAPFSPNYVACFQEFHSSSMTPPPVEYPGSTFTANGYNTNGNAHMHLSGQAQEFVVPPSYQLQVDPPQDNIQFDPAVFLPVKEVTNVMFAPEFVPGQREHVTIAMLGGKVMQA